MSTNTYKQFFVCMYVCVYAQRQHISLTVLQFLLLPQASSHFIICSVVQQQQHTTNKQIHSCISLYVRVSAINMTNAVVSSFCWKNYCFLLFFDFPFHYCFCCFCCFCVYSSFFIGKTTNNDKCQTSSVNGEVINQ